MAEATVPRSRVNSSSVVIEELVQPSSGRILKLTLKATEIKEPQVKEEEVKTSPHIRWSEDTVNNEHLKRKSSKSESIKPFN